MPHSKQNEHYSHIQGGAHHLHTGKLHSEEMSEKYLAIQHRILETKKKVDNSLKWFGFFR